MCGISGSPGSSKCLFPLQASKIKRCAVPSYFATQNNPLNSFGLLLSYSTAPTSHKLSTILCPCLTILHACLGSFERVNIGGFRIFSGCAVFPHMCWKHFLNRDNGSCTSVRQSNPVSTMAYRNGFFFYIHLGRVCVPQGASCGLSGKVAPEERELASYL